MIAVCCSQSHSKSHALTKGKKRRRRRRLPLSQTSSAAARHFPTFFGGNPKLFFLLLLLRREKKPSSKQPFVFPYFYTQYILGKTELDTLHTAKSMRDVTLSLFGQGKNWRLNRTHLFFSPFFVQSQPRRHRRHCLHRSGEMEKYVSAWRRNWERRGCIVCRFLEACRPNERCMHPSGQTPIFHVSIFYVRTTMSLRSRPTNETAFPSIRKATCGGWKYNAPKISSP